MAYEHIKVSDVIDNTKSVKERVADSKFVKNPPDPTKVDLNRIKFHDTIPVHNGLYEFMEELRKEIPSIQFGVWRGAANADVDISTDKEVWANVRVICEVHAYIPDDLYTLGRIGFADYCTSRAKDNVKRNPSYMVSSSRIENTRYDKYRDQYNMLMSKSLSNAVSSAKKYLRRYSPTDLISTVYRKVTDDLGMHNYVKKRASEDARGKLSDRNTIKELKNLVTSGYKFIHSDVEEYIKDAIIKHDIYEEAKNAKIAGKFVSVTNQLGTQMFDVVPVDDVARMDNLFGKPTTSDGLRYRAEDVPEELMGRVAVLSMAQSNNYIEGVGSRLGDTIFWVQDET
jgi:hypothetical protein